MNILSTIQIKNLIIETNVNFVAYVVTSWHLAGAKAVFLYLQSQGINLRPIYIVDEHPDGGYLVQDDKDINLYHRKRNNSLNLKYIIFLIKCFFRKKNNSSDLYLVNAWKADFKLVYQTIPTIDTKFKIILFEDGASSYRQDYNNISYFVGKLNFYQLLNKIINIHLAKLYEKNGFIQYFTPFKSNMLNLEINTDVVCYYKKALNIKSISLFENRIIIAMQSKEIEEIKVVKQIVKTLVDLGFDVFIKEHPRFPIHDAELDKYIVKSRKKALEMIIPEICPMYIIGFWSTSLLTMAYFYGLKSISLFYFLNWNRMDIEELNANQWFYNTFKSFVCYPRSIDELIKIIK